jgi:UDP-N-acetylglucosamine 2-epimerase (non-hydrolysing)
MRVMCVAGARPNFMKVKPVLDALERRGLPTVLVHTGQHYDEAMSDVFFRDLGLRPPDHHLDVGSGTHAQQTAAVMVAFEPLVENVGPDAVLVVGDVNSTVACALVAAKAGVLLGHVEAGLRSRDWSMPEEINRVVTDRLSDHLFAPSADAVDNLLDEGARPDQVHLVGNVMVDTLLANVERARAGGTLERLGLAPGGYGVVTLHRPANVDDIAVLAGIVSALQEVARLVPLVFPVHPRTAAALGELAQSPGLQIIEPARYLDFIALEADAALVLTDSGGVQEETTVLGVPCLTLRENTERPVTVTEGTNTVVGRDPARILHAARAALETPRRPCQVPFWDGHAGDRIADALVAGGLAADRVRPTGPGSGASPGGEPGAGSAAGSS